MDRSSFVATAVAGLVLPTLVVSIIATSVAMALAFWWAAWMSHRSTPQRESA